MIPLVADLTAAVAGRDAEAAAYVHRGATSQDILDTATMLVAARALDAVLADLARTAGALRRTAAEHRDTPMPGRTLTQHAVPTTFGLKAAGWRTLVLDARDRLASVRAALPVQLGGAAGTLAAFHAYAEAEGGPVPAPGLGGRLLARYAAETGLAEPALPWHTLRTPVADLAGALAFTAGALGKLAADVLVLSRTEIGEVAEGSGGGSSAMPHKANPVRATLIAAAARQVPGSGRGAVRLAGRRGRTPGRRLARRVAAAAGGPAAGRRRGPGRRRTHRGTAGPPAPHAAEPRRDRRPGRHRTPRRGPRRPDRPRRGPPHHGHGGPAHHAGGHRAGSGAARRAGGRPPARRRGARRGADGPRSVRPPGRLVRHPSRSSGTPAASPGTPAPSPGTPAASSGTSAPSPGTPAPSPGIPSLPAARLRQLLDPTDYLGSAGAFVDRALARTENDPQEPV